tara:strand:- start:118 stop:1077 length:960 start_codon:yes stop_codon:yes gene_type:complete
MHLQVSASGCGLELEKIREKLLQHGDLLSELTHTPLFKSIIQNPSTESVQLAESIQLANNAIDIVLGLKVKGIKPKKNFKPKELLDAITRVKDPASRDFARGLLVRCLIRQILKCKQGILDIIDFNKRKNINYNLDQYEIGENGLTKKGEPILISMNNGSMTNKEFMENSVRLSDNLDEAGNIKIREGIGAVRFMQSRRKKIDNYHGPLEKVDFIDDNGVTYQLKGPFTTEKMESFYELHRKRLNKKGISDSDLILREIKDQIDRDINSVMKELNGPGKADVLIVDLLGHPKSVKDYIKKTVLERLDGKPTKKIDWVMD